MPTAIEVGNVDVEFGVSNGAALLGTVTVSRGGIDWRASSRRSAMSATWNEFAELMAGESAPPARSRGRWSTRTAPPTQAGRSASAGTAAPAGSASADAATVRAWARNNSFDVNTCGAISTAVRDGYQEANR